MRSLTTCAVVCPPSTEKMRTPLSDTIRRAVTGVIDRLSIGTMRILFLRCGNRLAICCSNTARAPTAAVDVEILVLEEVHRDADFIVAREGGN
jgi:hypothetical protein